MLVGAVLVVGAGSTPAGAATVVPATAAADPCSYTYRYECGTSQISNTRSDTQGRSARNYARDTDSRYLDKDVGITDSAGRTSFQAGSGDTVSFGYTPFYGFLFCDYGGISGVKVGCNYTN